MYSKNTIILYALQVKCMQCGNIMLFQQNHEMIGVRSSVFSSSAIASLYSFQSKYVTLLLVQILSKKQKGETPVRTYRTTMQEVQTIDHIYCDCCGREIQPEKEDFLHFAKEWGYLSHKDGDCHTWDICEACYDQWTSTFAKAK